MSDDPLVNILRSKRETTRFQVLAEIAEHQPSIRQQEIAERLEVTPQAISDYIRDLTDDGLVNAEGRGRYYITYKGVEWVINNAEILEGYAKHIRRDIIHQIVTWAAIADTDLKKGDSVGVYMKDGWLYAGKVPQSAMGVVVIEAEKGDDVGVAKLAGIIDHKEGRVEVAKIPRIERGGSKKVDAAKLIELAKQTEIIATVGLESYIAVRNAGLKADLYLGAREGTIEAAFQGIHCLMVIVDEDFTDFIHRLEQSGLTYSIHDLVKN
ncbi:MAG TPA: winged helix-turn-helix transcriptional regulator [Methanocorpusculum sp.]|nr:winged helix-turn-helix transcriptional regulator [Methanocorpusculum sp.]